MAGENFNGVFKYETSDKFEEYMKAIGVGMAMRKMGNLAKPTVTVKIEGNDFYLKSESTFKTIILKCTIGEEYDEETTDGRKCKSIMKWEGDKLVQTQRWGDNKETTITRFIDPSDNDRLSMICVYKDVTSTRSYRR